MINWLAVALVPLCVALGMELARRKKVAAGDIFSFQPKWVHRTLSYLLTVALVLFVEAARASLAEPSRFHLWILILSTVSAVLLNAMWSGAEFYYAKKRVKELLASPADN